jgi:hypothetical protein
MHERSQSQLLIFLENLRNLNLAVKHALNASERLPAHEVVICIPRIGDSEKTEEELSSLLSSHGLVFRLIFYSLSEKDSALRNASEKSDVLYMFTDLSEAELQKFGNLSCPVVSFSSKEKL